MLSDLLMVLLENFKYVPLPFFFFSKHKSDYWVEANAALLFGAQLLVGNESEPFEEPGDRNEWIVFVHTCCV